MSRTQQIRDLQEQVAGQKYYDPIAQVYKSAIEPSTGDVHVDQPLTDVSIAYMQEESSYIAMQVFPQVNVAKKTNQYWVVDRSPFWRREMGVRAPATESDGIGWKISTENYDCTKKAVHTDVPDDTLANEDMGVDAEDTAAELVTSQAMTDSEWSFGQDAWADAKWTFNADGNATATAYGTFDPTHATNNRVEYWNRDTSNPIMDVRRARRFVQRYTGRLPNVFSLGAEVFDTLAEHPDIIGRIDRGQSMGAARATEDDLARIFGVDQVLVAEAVYDSAVEGATASFSHILDTHHALLSYRPPRPALRTPSAGYTFTWDGYLGMTDMGVRIKRIYMPLKEATRIESETAFDHKVTGKDLGYFFVGAVQ